MKILVIVALILGVFQMPSPSFAVKLDTGGKSEAELNTEMVIRCQYQMGEFGNQGIDICIKGERAAFSELSGYPDELRDIVRRCTRVMYKAGWAMVQQCSDKDVAARDALPTYSEKYPDIVEMCTDKVGRYGQNEIKKCADQKLAERDGSNE